MRSMLMMSVVLTVLAVAPLRAQVPAAAISPEQGAVLIYADAPNATVLIDGTRRGSMPVSADTGFRAMLPAGRHEIEVQRSLNNRFYDLSARTTANVDDDALVPVTLPALAPRPVPGAAARIDAVVGAFLPDTVTVPQGSFMMGGRDAEDSADNEFPRHTVTIAQPFLMQKRNVTFDQWDACVADGGCSYVPDDEGHGRGDRSAFNLSWEDAEKFAAWISRRLQRECRLPSEAQWEYAARGGTQTAYFFGDDASRIGDYVARGGDYPTAVEARQPNKYGLYSMAGGVAEWVADCWHRDYKGAPSDGSAWLEGTCKARSVRGGIWDASAWYMRSARRSAMTPANRYNYVGFRLVCEMK